MPRVDGEKLRFPGRGILDAVQQSHFQQQQYRTIYGRLPNPFGLQGLDHLTDGISAWMIGKKLPDSHPLRRTGDPMRLKMSRNPGIAFIFRVRHLRNFLVSRSKSISAASNRSPIHSGTGDLQQ